MLLYIYFWGAGVLLKPCGSVEKHVLSSMKKLSDCQRNIERERRKHFMQLFAQGSKYNSHKNQLLQL